MVVENTSYPLNISWSLTPLKSELFNATLYLSTYFNLTYDFDKTQIPQLLLGKLIGMHLQPYKNCDGTSWAAASFTNTTLKDNYIGLYDDKNDIAFAFKFNDLPDREHWSSCG